MGYNPDLKRHWDKLRGILLPQRKSFPAHVEVVERLQGPYKYSENDRWELWYFRSRRMFNWWIRPEVRTLWDTVDGETSEGGG